jgi:hypothetical protein
MEVRRGPVLAIVLASYTMIVLGISIVITALPKIHSLDFPATSLRRPYRQPRVGR